jgi:hypothetical protein
LTCVYNAKFAIPRAGHDLPDDSFYKNKNNNREMVPIDFTAGLFCRGFNITIAQFLIVRRQLILMLLENDLYKENLRKTETQFKLAELEEKISQHIILKSTTPPAYWRKIMFPKMVSKVAEFMKESVKNYEHCFEPGDYFPMIHVGWGSAVPTSTDRRYALKDMTITIEIFPLLTVSFATFETMVDNIIVFQPGRTNTIPVYYWKKIDKQLEDVSYNALWSKTKTHFRAEMEDGEWTLAYLHPGWGNYLVTVSNDHELQAALFALHTSGPRTFNLRVSIFTRGSITRRLIRIYRFMSGT